MTVASLLCVAALAFAPADEAAERPLSGAAAERAAEAALEATLDGPPPEWVRLQNAQFWKETSFPQAVAKLGAVADVAVILDRSAFESDPADLPFAPPTPRAMDEAPTLRAAFDVLLDAAGGPPLVLENRAGLLRITAPGDAAGNLTPRVYDVRGLSESLGLTESDRTEGTVVQRIAGPGAGRAPTRLDPPLIFALKTGVGPGPGVAEWDTAGGPAAIAELGGRLVVRQSPAGHAALARLLDDLRASADAPAQAAPASTAAPQSPAE